MENKYSPMQVIDREGDFNATVLDEFMQKTDLYNCGLSCAVVAIMGPQSSESDPISIRRNRTTQGIWMQKCADCVEPSLVAMDLEGSDGSERGEDDTAFEKQSALFALTVADIVIINLWYHDVGREQAASKPLLRTVFQVLI
ncbi:hypothetical protein PTKIN_Ptkin16aG0509400 [Pterospermum kingtungense]